MAAPAQATDITVALDQIKPDSYLLRGNSSGEIYTVVYLGPQTDSPTPVYKAQAYKGDVLPGRPYFPPIATFHLDATGNLLRHIDEGTGEITRYDPHDCSRVLGTCDYTRHNQNGAQEMRSEIHLHPDGFRQRVYSEPDNRSVFGKTIKLGKFGTARTVFQVGPGRRTYQTNTLRAVFR